VYAYVAYRIGEGPDAEDVTSETFERALRYRDSFDPRKGSPLTWLLGIARRCIADAALRPREAADPAEAPEPEAPGELASDTVMRLEVAEALQQLTDGERELIALRFGADLTAKQIGELFEMKTNAVEVSLYRTLSRLRILMGEESVDSSESEQRRRRNPSGGTGAAERPAEQS
jgi:RNA polymerase sigma-70 factor (ECF subfamily)